MQNQSQCRGMAKSMGAAVSDTLSPNPPVTVLGISSDQSNNISSTHEVSRERQSELLVLAKALLLNFCLSPDEWIIQSFVFSCINKPAQTENILLHHAFNMISQLFPRHDTYTQ